MKYYVVRHAAHEAYPSIDRGMLRWFGRPHVLHHTHQDALAYIDDIMHICDDPMLDDELIVTEVDDV